MAGCKNQRGRAGLFGQGPGRVDGHAGQPAQATALQWRQEADIRLFAIIARRERCGLPKVPVSCADQAWSPSLPLFDPESYHAKALLNALLLGIHVHVAVRAGREPRSHGQKAALSRQWLSSAIAHGPGTLAIRRSAGFIWLGALNLVRIWQLSLEGLQAGNQLFLGADLLDGEVLERLT